MSATSKAMRQLNKGEEKKVPSKVFVERTINKDEILSILHDWHLEFPQINTLLITWSHFFFLPETSKARHTMLWMLCAHDGSLLSRK